MARKQTGDCVNAISRKGQSLFHNKVQNFLWHINLFYNIPCQLIGNCCFSRCKSLFFRTLRRDANDCFRLSIDLYRNLHFIIPHRLCIMLRPFILKYGVRMSKLLPQFLGKMRRKRRQKNYGRLQCLLIDTALPARSSYYCTP